MNISTGARLRALVLVSASVGAGAPAASSAAEGAADEAVLEEVVVTAQRREESAQSVAIAVTALSGDALKEYVSGQFGNNEFYGAPREYGVRGSVRF